MRKDEVSGNTLRAEEWLPPVMAGGLPPSAYGTFLPPSDTYKIINELLTEQMAEKLKVSPMWPVLSKSFILSFIDNAEAQSLERLFESEVCKQLRSLEPNNPENRELVELMGQARWMFRANLNRARGTVNTSKVNERTAQISQMQFGVTSTTQQSGGSSGPGFFGRLAGRFKR